MHFPIGSIICSFPTSSFSNLYTLKLSVSLGRSLEMADRILDYTIGPVGRSALIATTSNRTRRGYPNVDFVYPYTDDGESLLVEIPVAEMFRNDFVVYLSGNNDMDETYERFDRGTLQFIRPEHVAFPDDRPKKKTTEMHIKSGEYFLSEDSDKTKDQVQFTVMNGGDASQYAQHPYLHVRNKSNECRFRSPTFVLENPKAFRKAVVFNFIPDPGSASPPHLGLEPVPRCPSSGPAIKSDQWFDSVQILFSQLKQGGKILTINFRFVEKTNDSGAEVVPVLFDMTHVTAQWGHVTVVTIKLKRAIIPKPADLVQT